MAQRTVYLIKHLGWAYNDECTVPHCADVVRAYARRDEAERQRFILELAGGGDDDEGGCASSLKLADGDSEEALLQRFGIPEPPLTVYDERHWNNVPWHRQVLEQIGGERYDEFRQSFAVRTYLYHVIETELEV